MPVRIGHREFAPGIPGTLLTLLVSAGLASLGLWQLSRAEEKRDLLSGFAAGQASVVAFNAANAGSLPRYQRVTAAGRYDPARQLLLDNMPSHTGRAGYHVLTPFRLEDGGLVLVNRGWVPLGADRSRLPDLGVADDPRQLVGLLDELPRPGIRLGQAEEARISWPKVANFPEHGQLVALYGEALLRPVLLLDATADSGYERVWEARFGLSPRQHAGYAIQWFALAAAVLVIYFVVNLRTQASSPQAG